MKFLLKISGMMGSQAGRNVTYLGVLQVVNLVIPMATTPWILRALEPFAYGKFALASTLVGYVGVFANFGFNMSATQRVAQMRDDSAALTRYFWVVQICRAILAFIGILLMVSVVASVPKLRPLIGLTLLLSLMVVNALLFPQWLFLGMEKMREIAVASIIARTLIIIPIFLFVRTPEDVTKFAIISVVGSLVSGLISCVIIVKYRLVGNFIAPDSGEVLSAFRDSWHLFLAQVSVTLYSLSNVLILGLVQGNYQVGIFSAADRMRTYSLVPIEPVRSTFFPRLSREMQSDRSIAVKTIIQIFLSLGFIMGGVSLALYFGAEVIVRIIMGPEFQDSVAVLRILALLPFLEAVNTVLGPLSMVNLGLKKSMARCVMIGGVCNVGLLVILGKNYGAVGAATALLITNLVVVLLMAVSLRRDGFLKELTVAIGQKVRRSE